MTFNEENYILRCLKSIEKTGIKYVYIEDANSADRTVQLIKEFNTQLEINLFTNNYRKPPYDSIYDLIKSTKTQWYYLIGADDILEPDAFSKFGNLLANNTNYHVPLMNFWSEIEEKSLGIYPESDWLYQLNNIKSKTDLVKTCLDYGTLDVLVLAVSKRSTSLWAYENLKVTNKEGINFWIVLVSLLLEKEKPLVSTTQDPLLIKTFDQITPSGNEHPDNDRVLDNGLSYLITCTINSIYNIFVVSIRFRLPISAILSLIFQDRGKKVHARPICNAPISKNVINQIKNKFFKILRNKKI